MCLAWRSAVKGQGRMAGLLIAGASRDQAQKSPVEPWLPGCLQYVVTN